MTATVRPHRHIEPVNLSELLDVPEPWFTLGVASVYLLDDEVVESECRRCDVRWAASLDDTSCWMCGAVDSTNVRRLTLNGSSTHV